jgi:hypothetical protein
MQMGKEITLQNGLITKYIAKKDADWERKNPAKWPCKLLLKKFLLPYMYISVDLLE